jgi:hypothetical protein
MLTQLKEAYPEEVEALEKAEMEVMDILSEPPPAQDD